MCLAFICFCISTSFIQANFELLYSTVLCLLIHDSLQNMSKKEDKSGGYDYSFIGTPDDDLVCSICLLVQREPVLTSCCGNHFCLTCIESVRSQNMSCPLCNAQTFSTMIDKYFVRKTKELNVRCPQKGCLWEGTLGSLEHHRDIEIGDCKFLITTCPNSCGKRISSVQLDEHCKVCPRRPHVCKFCEYKGIYEDMSSKHWTVCENYPLPCPNRCGMLDIKRKYLKSHQESDCLLELVECDFAFGGCQVRIPRGELPKHLLENTHNHLMIVSTQCTQLMKQLPRDFNQTIHQELAARDAEILKIQDQLNQRDQEVKQLKARLQAVEEDLDDVKSDCHVLKSTVFVPPVEFVMTDFTRHKRNALQWLGPPFYSHLGGYCLCLSVDANGSEDGKGTHISMYVNLMKGEFDEHLRWPFRGNVKVVLCNLRQSEGSIVESIMFGYDTPPEVSGRVHGEVAESGLGIPKFIEHAQLGFNPSKNTEFLKNNCLCLKVCSVATD